MFVVSFLKVYAVADEDKIKERTEQKGIGNQNDREMREFKKENKLLKTHVNGTPARWSEWMQCTCHSDFTPFQIYFFVYFNSIIFKQMRNWWCDGWADVNHIIPNLQKVAFRFWFNAVRTLNCVLTWEKPIPQTTQCKFRCSRTLAIVSNIGMYVCGWRISMYKERIYWKFFFNFSCSICFLLVQEFCLQSIKR